VDGDARDAGRNDSCDTDVGEGNVCTHGDRALAYAYADHVCGDTGTERVYHMAVCGRWRRSALVYG